MRREQGCGLSAHDGWVMWAVRVAVACARAATGGGDAEWKQCAQQLEELSGKAWLLLDDAARYYSYMGEVPVSGVHGWLSESMDEATGFVAAVTSLHADGRIRQRATRVLAHGTGGLRASALALRTIDHVAEVRADAMEGLLLRLDVVVAEPVLALLLAARGRQYAPAALDEVRATLLERVRPSALVHALFASDQRDVRRWAFDVAHECRLLRVDQLLAAAKSDPDQLMRATCARWLVDVASGAELATLLRAGSADARLSVGERSNPSHHRRMGAARRAQLAIADAAAWAKSSTIFSTASPPCSAAARRARNNIRATKGRITG